MYYYITYYSVFLFFWVGGGQVGKEKVKRMGNLWRGEGKVTTYQWS